MKTFVFVWLICTLMITTAAISYIDTSSKSTLQVNENLTSPLGRYKMRLRANCSIELLKYSAEQKQYNQSSVIDPGLGKQCNSISLSLPNQSLMTDDGRIFKKPNLNQQITRMKFKITDIGAVLLVSFFDGPDNTVQYAVDNFNGNSPEPEGQFLYNLQDRASYRNKNEWKFDNVNGAISVSKSTGTGQLKTIDLQNYKLRETGFTDSQGQTRYALIPGSTMKPKSSSGTCGSQPQGVFMHFDQYWPIVQVYDDDKYVVAEYSLDGSPKNVCPQKSFEYQGQCVTECPSPFYKQFHGSSGSCVLSCQTDFIVDDRQRTCTNANLKPPSNYNYNSILSRQCPSQSSQYEYGCICASPKYYNFQANTCIDACSDGYYGSAGICMNCPSKCKTCSINTDTKQQYLTCTSCTSATSTIPSCIPPQTQCTSTPNCQQCSHNNSQQNIQQFCNKCLPFFSLSSNKQSCLYNCPVGEYSAVGSTGEGYCVKFLDPNNDKGENFVTGVYDGVGYLIRKAGTCPANMKIWRDRCVANCPAGTDQNIQKRCICGTDFATVQNDTCIRISDMPQNIGMYYSSTYNAFLNCPIGCLTCDNTICLKCQPGHILVASSTSSVCRQQNLHFNCNSQYYTYDKDNKVCIANSIVKSVSNITNCKTEVFGKCAVCKSGYFLNNKACTNVCGNGYYAQQGTCIKKLDNCDIPQLSNTAVSTPINSQILSTQAYQQYSSNHQQISNDPFTQILTIRDQLGIPTTASTPVMGTFYTPRIACKLKSANGISPNPNPPIITPVVNDICTDPLKPYMLLNNTCASECPINTYAFNSGSSKNTMCLTNTQCFYKNASTPYSMPDGSCIDQCPLATVPTVFGNGESIQCISQTECQKINPITPFQLENTTCASACPLGYAPQLQYTSLICTPTNKTEVQKSMNIDSSVFQLNKDGDLTYKLFYFVVDRPLNLSDVQVNYYKLGVNNTKPIPQLSQSLNQYLTDNVDYAQFNDKTYLAIRTAADQVVLDLTKNIKQFSSNSGNRLSSSIYGVSLHENRLQNVHSWLAIIAFVLSLLLIILHSIYIGNQLLYKVDHYLIFAQSLFYFSFVHLLINSSIAQFYYGFLWSHFGFFPNYFKPTIPGGYMQSYGASSGILNNGGNFVPNAYRLLTGDANFIRNAGFSFSLLCTFLAAFLIVVIVILLMKAICKKYQIWYKRIAKQALIAAWQFVSMNIFYWAVSHLLTNRNQLFSGSQNEPSQYISFRNSCSAAAIAWICIYGVYMILRFVRNQIGGLYMFKRLAIATILAAAAYHNNGNGMYKLFIIPLAALEVMFMVLRFIIEKPYLRRQKVFIILETVLILICYFTIFLWNDTGFVSVFVSLVLFFFIFLLVSDLLDVYLDNKDEYYGDDVKILPGLRQKQKLDAKDYEKLENYGSIPQSDRRLRNQ